jgi:hypothetical protein
LHDKLLPIGNICRSIGCLGVIVKS